MWNGAIDHSWALHREHIRAGRRVILYGPDPDEIYPPAKWPEIESALLGELDFVEKHLHDYPDYCILNLCRLMYSFETSDVVVSKALAAELAYDVLRRGGLAPAVLNAADEIAVEAFLQGKIRFTAIHAAVERTLAAHLRHPHGRHAGLADIKEADAWARACAREVIERL